MWGRCFDKGKGYEIFVQKFLIIGLIRFTVTIIVDGILGSQRTDSISERNTSTLYRSVGL